MEWREDFGGGQYPSSVRIQHPGERDLFSDSPSVEGGVCALLMMSIFQSAFALKYPKDPFPPIPTPVKPFNTPANSPAVSKHKILSPTACSPRNRMCPRVLTRVFQKVTPQKQKPFNPASSTLSTSTYLTSPVSTPSRTLNYKLPTASPFNDSTNSNVSMSTGVPPSPSPLLSSPLMAYRGKHSHTAGSGYRVHFYGSNNR